MFCAYPPLSNPFWGEGGRKSCYQFNLGRFRIALLYLLASSNASDKQEDRCRCSALSAIFAAFCKRMDQTNGHRLNQTPFDKPEYFTVASREYLPHSMAYHCRQISMLYLLSPMLSAGEFADPRVTGHFTWCS